MLAIRRHHRHRLMKTRRDYHGGVAASSRRNLSRVTRTPCLCSCWMCGNSRRAEGDTLQERRAADGMREDTA